MIKFNTVTSKVNAFAIFKIKLHQNKKWFENIFNNKVLTSLVSIIIFFISKSAYTMY